MSKVINLCHFAITFADTGVRLEACSTPLKFEPVLVENGADWSTITGFKPLENLPVIEAEDVVIVPRFAAAIDYALKFTPHVRCIPLAYMGQRGSATGDVTLLSVESLDAAPSWLPFKFRQLPDERTICFIQRLIGGNFPIKFRYPREAKIREVPPPANPAQVVTTLSDGTVSFDGTIDPDTDAVIIPQDGAIIRYFRAEYPDLVLLVTSTIRADKTVDLYIV